MESVGEMNELLWSRTSLMSTKAKRVTSLVGREHVEIELRSGFVVVSGKSGIQAVPVNGESLIMCDGRRMLTIKTFDRVVRLVFNSIEEKSRWSEAIKEEQRAKNRKKLSDFKVIRKLGEGGMGQVFLVQDAKTGERAAMKVVEKDSDITSTALRRAVDERLLLESFNFPFIVDLKYAFQSEHHLFMLTEYCEGGDLHHYMKRRNYKISEHTVKNILAELVLALEYVHQSGAIYRDLKPENILLDGSGHVKLADFGLSKKLAGGRDGRAYSLCGTRHYIAPELFLQKGYRQSADIWSLGILLYVLLEGYAPFEMSPTASALKKHLLSFRPDVSMEAKDTVYALLAFNPKERPAIEEVKNLPFFRDVDFASVKQNAQNLNVNLYSQMDIPAFLDEANPEGSDFASKISMISSESQPKFLKKLISRKSTKDFIPGYSFWSSS
eukprot:CAMPEP_0113962104 /NCGR_PEP_ID=MMETSP0011_2-20120614/5714_1 /TAXON_ID=101924 /ORGANISM="Rhodosorus marinus" /LENGTH=439 /DNA_ID=CAMNT_0000973889 /DNA_START=109 /DNA_END=1428 /DNA_ORIENTATION=+ /assembly_acc=CAM_ASM_000156